MITERFSQLFNLLLARWTRYQDAPRNPALVTDLAAARVALDEVRSDIAVERSLISVGHSAGDAGPRVAVSDSDLRKLRVSAIGIDGNA